jgi:type VI protein secretion system component VasF
MMKVMIMCSGTKVSLDDLAKMQHHPDNVEWNIIKQEWVLHQEYDKEYQMSKHFNTTKYKKKEKLMNLFVWAVLGFAVLGVMASFSFALNLIWRLIQ